MKLLTNSNLKTEWNIFFKFSWPSQNTLTLRLAFQNILRELDKGKEENLMTHSSKNVVKMRSKIRGKLVTSSMGSPKITVNRIGDSDMKTVFNVWV